MEDAPFTNDFRDSSNSRQSVTSNSEFAAYPSFDEIYIQPLLHPDEAPRSLRCPAPLERTNPILSLSVVPPYVLAASIDRAIYVFNLTSCSLRCTLPGTGRSVTSIAFSGTDSTRVATGHIDGSVCLWDLDVLDRPLQRFTVRGAACNAIAWSPADANVIASAHDGKLFVWHVGRSTSQPICCLDDVVGFDAFAWHPGTSRRFAASTSGGELRFYDFSTNIKDPHAVGPPESSDEEGDGGVFGPPDDIQKDQQAVSLVRLEAPLRSVLWVGDTTMIGLPTNGTDVLLYEIKYDDRELIQGWSSRFEDAVKAVQLIRHDRSVIIAGIGQNSVQCRTIPADLVDNLHLSSTHHEHSVTGTTEAPEAHSTNASKTTSDRMKTETCVTPTMGPVSIRDQRREASAFERTSRQLRQKRHSSLRRSRTDNTGTNSHTLSETREQSTPSPTRTLTSDLDVSIFPDEDDIGSPMPFLSPGIPSSKISPSDIPPLNGSTITSGQLPVSSFESSSRSSAVVPSTEPDSDDSDDETYVDDMHGSATFLPGGINVPLPKACGALFAPNGQLLLFFPPRLQQSSAPLEVTDDEPREKVRKIDRAKKLFPTFGNLDTDSTLSNEGSDSDDTLSLSDDERNDMRLPRFSFQPASLPTQLSWQPRDMIAYPSQSLPHSQQKIIVSVREINDVPALHQAQRKIAKAYRLLCNAGESGAQLCEHNARVAEESGFEEVAHLWRLIALLLEDRLPLESLSIHSRDEDILVIAQRASLLRRHDLGIDFVASSQQSAYNGKLRWANHAFGGCWLVRRIFEWAETHSDVQSLACFSGILLEAERKIPLMNATADESIFTHLSTYSPDYFTDATGSASGRTSRRAIPVLRTRAATIDSLHESPTKLLHESDPSSRIASQSSTPYLDSHGTPPFSFPPLSRESTRLSTSGSASPEFQRGSFSAAAKYYAQSFSEKFGSYGTSPPAKKASASPTTNSELSSSFPTGSWPGKSVSFASTTTEETSPRTSATPAFRGRNDDDGYDSDKTIEDTSAPHTPRSPSGAVIVNVGNQDAFTDDISGVAKVKLMPDDLAEKVVIWNQYYAELLRSSDMLAQASELEKVVGLTIRIPPQLGGAELSNVAVQPATASNKRKASCEICLTVTKGIMQICPSCLHSSHLQCLEEYSIALGEGGFTCPSGCECLCSELPYVVQDHPRHSPERPAFKKKPSFTDPRRWRARVDGDSW